MKVSVIVPTFNGAFKLPKLLRALEGQISKDFEVLVIVDGSTDNTVNDLQNTKYNILNLEVHVQENQGRAAVRNRGAERSKGDLLIFFDDDMRPEPDCIAQHIKHHQNFPGSLMSGAQIDDDRLANTPFQSYKCFLSNTWAKHLRNKQNIPLEFHELHLTAANFSVRKDIFEELGGFDENLKDAEDFDLAVRAFKKGYSIYYNHNAFAWHDDFPSCRSFIKRQREYLEYHTYLLDKKPEVYHDVFRLKKANNLNWSKKLFYSFWKSRWLVNFADKNHLSFLPRSVQYKIYDWIVASHVLLRKKKH